MITYRQTNQSVRKRVKIHTHTHVRFFICTFTTPSSDLKFLPSCYCIFSKSPPRVRQFYRRETFHPPGISLTAAVLKAVTKKDPVFVFFFYIVSLGLCRLSHRGTRFSVSCSCPVLSAILSQPFHIAIIFKLATAGFASALETGGNRSERNTADRISISVAYLVTELYKM